MFMQAGLFTTHISFILVNIFAGIVQHNTKTIAINLTNNRIAVYLCYAISVCYCQVIACFLGLYLPIEPGSIFE